MGKVLTERQGSPGSMIMAGEEHFAYLKHGETLRRT